MEKSLDQMLNPEQYYRDVTERYGINLRASGRSVSMRIDDGLSFGQLGLTKGPEALRDAIMRIAPPGRFSSEMDLAATIAHEPNHVRGFIKALPFAEVTEEAACASQYAFEQWFKGLR